jgi:ABC-2 type transport system permease protein
MTAATPATAATAAGVESGSIYDLGYRSYDGPRLGRVHAIRSLFTHTLRSSFGIGRGGRAKIAPLTLGFIVCIPAVAIIAAQALLRQVPAGRGIEGALPIRYDTYAGTIGIFVILFCAAQAPDHFGRDQRWSLLSLYFSRALRRTDYVLARLGGFMVAVFLIGLLPLVLLFLGQVLLATDIPKGLADETPPLAKAALQAAFTAALLGGLSMTIAAFTPRRAYAVSGIIALFIVPNIVAGIVIGFGSVDIGRWLVLLSPTAVLDGTNAFLFGVSLPRQLEDVGAVLPDVAFPLAAMIGIAGSVIVTLRRFQRISA